MDTESVPTGFQNVDKTGESDYFIEYLKFVDSVPEFRSIKDRNYRALGLRPGDRVLDAGCGLGFDTYRIGALVGAQGTVIGLDSSTSMLYAAQSLIQNDLNHVTFMHGDIRNPDFEENFFDAIYVERLLQISPDPREIVTQLIRILKPGGTLVITEPDWGTMALDPGDRETIRSLISFCADSFPDGWTGRKLHRYFTESGLDTIIEVEPVIMQDFPTIRRAMNFDNFISGAVQNGNMSQVQADELMDGFQRAGEKGTFFFSYMIYRAIGRKRT